MEGNLKPRVIVIVGPTASGKTSTSIELAKIINGEIISADSMQIYREMNIGTAKPTEDEKCGIKHYMIDVVNPDEKFNVSKYKNMAEDCIEEILSKNKIPIIVGGTGLYVNTLINGIEFAEIESDIKYRESLIAEANENGPESIYKRLREVDPEAAEVIDMNNIRRVARALEIYKVTGKTKTVLDQESIKELKYDYKVFGLKWERNVLYERINKRVDIMLENGLIDEVKNLIEKYNVSSTAMQGLDYKEVVEYLNNEITYDELSEKLKMETRRYAKRQMTWFNRDQRIVWVDPQNSVSEILENL